MHRGQRKPKPVPTKTYAGQPAVSASVQVNVDDALRAGIREAIGRLEQDPVIKQLGLTITVESCVRAAIMLGLPHVGAARNEVQDEDEDAAVDVVPEDETDDVSEPAPRNSPDAADESVLSTPLDLTPWDNETDEIPDGAKDVFEYYAASCVGLKGKRGYRPYRLRLAKPETQAMLLGVAFWANRLQDQAGVEMHSKCKRFQFGDNSRGGKGAAHVFVLVNDPGIQDSESE